MYILCTCVLYASVIDKPYYTIGVALDSERPFEKVAIATTLPCLSWNTPVGILEVALSLCYNYYTTYIVCCKVRYCIKQLHYFQILHVRKYTIYGSVILNNFYTYIVHAGNYIV